MADSSTRREFLSTSAGIATGAVALGAWAGSPVLAASKEKIGIGVIGCGGMASGHVRFLVNQRLPVSFAHLCDPDPRQMENCAKPVAEFQQHQPQRVADFRRVLDDKNVDAVIIATPHHWHIPIALGALQAGKDVYVEKPASHVFQEGRLLVDAAHKYERVVQHGTQMRSSGVTAQAGQVLESGILGEIKITKAYNCQDRGFAKPVADSEPAQGVDYDRWLGPAPKRPFNENRFHRTWRLFRDYGNGDFGDDGAHDLDMARWALGVETHPVRITAHGSNIKQPGYREFPDNMIATFEYPDGRVLTYEDRLFTPYGMNGVDSSNVFYGTKGYMVFSRRGFFRTYLGRREQPGPASGKSGRVGAPVPSHMENFLSCVRTRQQTVADAETAHLTCALIHLGEIAYRTKTVLEFNPTTETITNSKTAHAMLTKEYRAPYGLPKTI